jgi:hypothetical protein
MSTSPLTIYVPAALAVSIKRAADRAGQSQSGWVVAQLEQIVAGRPDPLLELTTNQLVRLLAVADEWIEQLPEPKGASAKRKIAERTEKFKQAAFKRIST